MIVATYAGLIRITRLSATWLYWPARRPHVRITRLSATWLYCPARRPHVRITRLSATWLYWPARRPYVRITRLSGLRADEQSDGVAVGRQSARPPAWRVAWPNKLPGTILVGLITRMAGSRWRKWRLSRRAAGGGSGV